MASGQPFGYLDVDFGGWAGDVLPAVGLGFGEMPLLAGTEELVLCWAHPTARLARHGRAGEGSAVACRAGPVGTERPFILAV